MDKDSRVAMIRKLEKELNYKRFLHTMGVAYTATSLAMRYGEDVERAEIAGLLHDCAKCISTDRMMTLCKKKGFELDAVEKNNPALLHSKAGSVLAAEEYGIRDSAILSAICWHTTGRPDMTMLEKIIFISDYIEPGRTSAKRLPEIRAAAFRDLDEALLMILGDTLDYLQETGSRIDTQTARTYEFYRAESGR